MNENIINLIIQAKNLSSNALNQVKGQLADLSKSSEKTGNIMAGMGDNFKKAVSAVAIGAGIMGGALGIIGGIALKNAGNYETMGVALETSFGGNIEMAKQAEKQITEFATKTPYDLNQVMTSFIKLKNMGLDPSEKAMTSYGNTASAMGKNLDQMIEAVADAATGEFERLKEFGVRSKSEGDKVSFTFKGVTTTVGKNSKEIEDYLIKLGETNFAGGMEKQSQTLNGKLSTLKDTFDQTMASFAMDTGLLDWAKKAVDGATLVLGAIKPLYDLVVMGNYTGSLSKIFGWEEDDPTVDKILELRQIIIDFVSGAWENMKNAFIYLKDNVLPDLQNKFKEAQKWFEDNRPLVENVGLVLGSFAVAWGLVTLAIGIYTGVIGIATTATMIFGGVVGFLTSPFGIAVIAIGLLIAIGVLLWKNWDWIKAKAIEIGGAIAGWFAQKWKEIGDWFNWLGNEATRIWNEMLVSVGEFGKSVDGFFREMINNIINGFNGLDMWQIGSNIMSGLGDGLWGMVDVAMGPINWLMDQVNAVLGKQAQAQNNSQGAYNDSRAVSGKGSASQWGFAKGGAFQNGNVVAFADGGVVNRPTNFAMSGGRTGLMGEAGAEAIMPLSRGSDGKLGVKAEGAGGITININNPTFLGKETDNSNFVNIIKDALKREFPILKNA